MNSRFFIERPIFASVLSIIIVIVGLVSLKNLPIAQFPEITPPVVQIDADYPGASADVVAEAVARPIEVQLPGIDNLLYYESTSTNDGHMTMRLTFEIGTDIDIAQVQTQNRQKLAEPQLPDEVIRQGITVKKTSPDLLLVVALSSTDPSHDTIFLSNYALLRVLDNIKRLPGVGDASIFGGQNYSMRLILDPVRMAQLNFTPSDIVAAVREQNRDFPAGRIGREPMVNETELTIPVMTKGRMSEVKEFEEMIIRAYPDGSMVRLKDVSRVELGAQSYDLQARWNGRPNTFLLTYLSPGANALETAQRIRNEMDKLAKDFPAGASYDVPYDTTTFIEVSIQEVVKTLAEALLLVVLVVFVFLQSWRATLIPAIAAPISLIGTFMGMEALGFSINTLTLFGMVLSIGIVVDDAIVVVENVERHIAEGLTPKNAAIKAMQELFGALIAIILVLASVFLPVAFLGGITGELYKQFAVTIALSVMISGFVALTLSPALCALVLKPGHDSPNKLWKTFNRTFDWAQTRYVSMAGTIIKRSALSILIFLTVIFFAIGLFKTVPGGFLPEEDQGYFITVVQLPDGASISRTKKVLEKIESYFLSIPSVHSTDAMAGMNFVFSSRGPNHATMFVPLHHWDTRKNADEQVQNLIANAFGEFAKIPEALVLAFNAPSIRGLGATGGFSIQLQDPSGGDFSEFAETAQAFVNKAMEHPAIGIAGTNFRVSAPRMYAHVDRERAKALGVPISDVFDTMQAYFGNLYVNDFIKFGRVYRVQTEAPPEYRSSPDNISNIYVRAQSGTTSTMIPLDSVVTTEFNSGPDPVTHFNGFNSALVLGSAAPGYSSGQALDALQEVANEVLAPKGYTIDWSGITYQEKMAASGQKIWILSFALLMVFLVLAALYESWSVPFAVILAVPFGILGALLAIWARGLTDDIYFQVGLITLIGLSAKNAILIVEFASDLYAKGASLTEAALEAARVRFRPIIMTSMAFIMGVFPLAISSGAGAASRIAIGTTVLGGMLAATFLAIFFVPLFFVLIGKITRRDKHPTPEPVQAEAGDQAVTTNDKEDTDGK